MMSQKEIDNRLNAAYFIPNIKFALTDYYDNSKSEYKIITQLLRLNLIRHFVYNPKFFVKASPKILKTIAELLSNESKLLTLDIKLNSVTLPIYAYPIINNKTLQELKLHFYVNKAGMHDEAIRKILIANLRIYKFHMENDSSNRQTLQEAQYFANIFQNINQLYHLRKLQVSNLSLSGYEQHFYKILTELPNLKTLEINDIYCSEKNSQIIIDAFAFTKITNLKLSALLYYRETDILLEEKQVSILDLTYKCISLEKLEISARAGNTINQNTVIYLFNGNIGLKHLKFSFCNIHLKYLKLLNNLQNLESLSLIQCLFETDSMAEFTNAFKNLPSKLIQIQIMSPRLNYSESALQELLEQLPKVILENKNLKYVHLNYFNFKDEQLNAMVAGLSKSSKIAILDLSSNKLKCNCIDEFMEKILECNSLSILLLDFNKISVPDGINIAHKLEKHVSLEKASLIGNNYDYDFPKQYAKSRTTKIGLFVPIIPTERIQKITNEIKDLTENPLEDFYFKVSKDIGVWDAIVIGKKSTPYEGGKFKIRIKFSEYYPAVMPKIYFLTKIFHSNVNEISGKVWLSCFHKWQPTNSMRTVIIDVFGLFYTQYSMSILNKEASEMANVNKEEFDKKVRELTKKYAT